VETKDYVIQKWKLKDNQEFNFGTADKPQSTEKIPT